MINNPAVSIIVPVYNVENYLSRCLDSILSQTFVDYEVLLIDDGSTDCSRFICDEYAVRDNRIKVFHKKNGGVASARQLGLDNCCGEYVIHVDSDDWIEPTMLEELYVVAKKSNVDIVICDYYVNANLKQNYVRQKPLSLLPVEVLHSIFQNLHGSLWNKLVKKSCFERYKIHFLDGVDYCEDVLIWVQLLQHSDIKIEYIQKAFYHYYMNKDSITHAYTQRTYKVRCLYYQFLCSLLPLGFEYEKRKVRLEVLLEAYKYGVVTNSKVWFELFLHNKRAAFCEDKNLHRRLGYMFLFIGFWSIAKRLIQY